MNKLKIKMIEKTNMFLKKNKDLKKIQYINHSFSWPYTLGLHRTLHWIPFQ